MTSVVKICNLALLQVGENTIVSTDEKSKAARICKEIYAPGRDTVLESFPWSFAMRRGTLALLAGTAPIPWAYAYQKPADCLRAEEIIQKTPQGKPILFEVGEDQILTDQTEAVLLYVRQVDDPAQFSATFVEALSWYLASKLAAPLTGDVAKTKQCLLIYQTVVQRAQTIQANQGRSPDLSRPLPPWIDARDRD